MVALTMPNEPAAILYKTVANGFSVASHAATGLRTRALA